MKYLSIIFALLLVACEKESVELPTTPEPAFSGVTTVIIAELRIHWPDVDFVESGTRDGMTKMTGINGGGEQVEVWIDAYGSIHHCKIRGECDLCSVTAIPYGYGCDCSSGSLWECDHEKIEVTM